MTAGTYRFKAARGDGTILRGTVAAESEHEASAILTADDLHPIRVVQAPEPPRHRTSSRRDLAICFQGMALLVASGAPISQAVQGARPVASGRLLECLAAAENHLRAGKTLADALGSTAGVVPAPVLGMIRASEQGSRLGAGLEEVARQLESEADLIARTRQALAYPSLLVVVGSVSILIIGLVVVPKFAELLGDLGQAVPPATRILLFGASTVKAYALWMVVGGTLAALSLVRYRATAAGRVNWDRWLIALPVVGQIRLALATARLARSLGGMLAAGAPLLDALDASRVAVGDSAVAERVGRVRERVASGAPLATSLLGERAVLSLAGRVIGIGEASGQLGAMAIKAGELAATEAQRSLKTVVDFLEPSLVIFFGGLVAWVAIALLQAVYAIRPG